MEIKQTMIVVPKGNILFTKGKKYKCVRFGNNEYPVTEKVWDIRNDYRADQCISKNDLIIFKNDLNIKQFKIVEKIRTYTRKWEEQI